MTVLRRVRAGLGALRVARSSQSALTFPCPPGSAEGCGTWSPANPAQHEVVAGVQRWLGSRVFDTALTACTTEVVSMGVTLYASCFPKASWRTSGELAICVGLPIWAYPRGGICIGRAFLTGSPPSPQIIAHERRHVAQWLRYGALMPILYAASGSSALTNWFEVDAGLADGNYI